MKALRWIWKVVRQVAENDLHNHAAEMAYFTMMAVFPFFLLLTTAVAFLPIPNLFVESMDLLRTFAPAEVIRLLEDTIYEVTTVRKTNLLGATLIVCIWMSAGAMSSTTRGLNKAFGLRDPRHYVRFFGLSLFMTFALGLLVVLAIVVILLGPKIEYTVLRQIDLGWFGEILFKVLRNFVPVFFLFLAHAGIYWLCPAMKRKFRIFTPGTLFSVSAWIAVSFGFKAYLEQVNNYDRLYGSLGAVILCLFWFYLMSIILLIGGQIDALIHPEYKAPTSPAGEPLRQPFPWKLVLTFLVVLVGVPLGIRSFLSESSFTPAPRDVGGTLSTLIQKSLESGNLQLNHIEFDQLLKKHVNEAGMVDYPGLEKDLPILEAYLAKTKDYKIETLDGDALHALLLNLHNAGALRIAAKNYGKIRYLRDVSDAYEQAIATLGGEEISLSSIRDRILRFYFKDPRQIFALNDSSRSTPHLQRFAFNGETLPAQLDQVTKLALSPPQTIIEDGKILLPAVVARFREDFEDAAADRQLASWLKPHLNEEMQAILNSKGAEAFEFKKADVSLNARK